MYSRVFKVPRKINLLNTNFTLYFMRYGRPKWNRWLISKKGTAADLELSNQGVYEIKQISDSLRNIGLHFTGIVSAPEKRSVQTAEIVAASFGMPIDSINVCQDLHSRNYLGPRFSEKMPAEIYNSLTKMPYPIASRFSAEDKLNEIISQADLNNDPFHTFLRHLRAEGNFRGYRAFGKESKRQFDKRIIQAFEDILAQDVNHRLLFIGDGSCFRSLLEGLGESWDKIVPEFEFEYGKTFEVHNKEGKLEIKMLSGYSLVEKLPMYQ